MMAAFHYMIQQGSGTSSTGNQEQMPYFCSSYMYNTTEYIGTYIKWIKMI